MRYNERRIDMEYDTLERRIKKFLGDKKQFSEIIYDLSGTDFPAARLIDLISKVCIVVDKPKKVLRTLKKGKDSSIAESMLRICQYIYNASIGIYVTFPCLYIPVASISRALNDPPFQKDLGDDVTLFLKLFLQECHAYILGLKDTLITRCPQCGAVFVKSENRQKYCTPACSNNYRTEKYRRRHKNEQ